MPILPRNTLSARVAVIDTGNPVAIATSAYRATRLDDVAANSRAAR